MQAEAERIEQSRQYLIAGTVLLLVFCAFFWLGYFVGKNSAVQSPAPAATKPSPPAGERVLMRTAGR